MKKFLAGLRSRVMGFLYNEDRSGASIIYGTDQDTISSMVGRRAPTDPVAAVVADTLDTIQPGHTAAAIVHANALDAADNGVEK